MVKITVTIFGGKYPLKILNVNCDLNVKEQVVQRAGRGAFYSGTITSANAINEN